MRESAFAKEKINIEIDIPNGVHLCKKCGRLLAKNYLKSVCPICGPYKFISPLEEILGTSNKRYKE